MTGLVPPFFFAAADLPGPSGNCIAPCLPMWDAMRRDLCSSFVDPVTVDVSRSRQPQYAHPARPLLSGQHRETDFWHSCRKLPLIYRTVDCKQAGVKSLTRKSSDGNGFAR